MQQPNEEAHGSTTSTSAIGPTSMVSLETVSISCIPEIFLRPGSSAMSLSVTLILECGLMVPRLCSHNQGGENAAIRRLVRG